MANCAEPAKNAPLGAVFQSANICVNPNFDPNVHFQRSIKARVMIPDISLHLDNKQQIHIWPWHIFHCSRISSESGGGGGVRRVGTWSSAGFLLYFLIICINTAYYGHFNRQQIGDFLFFFVIFLWKRYLTFHKTICIKCLILFSEKKN